jgi:hypothetical protein
VGADNTRAKIEQRQKQNYSSYHDNVLVARLLVAASCLLGASAADSGHIFEYLLLN